ncbi:hypothetical protein L3Q82_000150 [Scortum barcoo]|uniref:Uncharacterized protein n=1 Tax=Scortum barcoo TaxID=214431 RepID=A0ACB8XAY5_9TELE|nr:hypothetical protein L3Q82_000150 [Scortum barcoo]
MDFFHFCPPEEDSAASGAEPPGLKQAENFSCRLELNRHWYHLTCEVTPYFTHKDIHMERHEHRLPGGFSLLWFRRYQTHEVSTERKNFYPQGGVVAGDLNTDVWMCVMEAEIKHRGQG